MGKRILLIEDDGMLSEAVTDRLSSDGYELDCVESGEAGIENARAVKYDVAILDFKLPGMDGLETLKKLRKQSPGTSVIFFTSHGNHELALNSLRLGASEYLNKPFNFDNLSFYVYKLIQRQESSMEFLDTEDGNSGTRIIFRSTAMRKIVSRIPVLAEAGLPILISGETGSGKELIARTILRHPRNPRANQPFFAVNCMAIPENLIESELFGHTRGAFTNALLDKKGFFEEADSGTLFLDEISGAPLAMQGKLLRVLENREYYRMGDTRPRKTDIAVIAATNLDLYAEMEHSRFRKDLFYRLNGLNIEIPPLRERRDDIIPLAEYFLDFANRKWNRSASFNLESLSVIESAGWPGNVRQLKSAVFAAVATSENDEIEIDDLPEDISASNGKTEAEDSLPVLSRLREQAVANVEKEYFSSLLTKLGGNVTKAAGEAGINRQNLTKKLKKLGINPDNYRNHD